MNYCATSTWQSEDSNTATAKFRCQTWPQTNVSSLNHTFRISNLKSSSSLFQLLPHDYFLSFHTKIMYEVLILPIKAKCTAVLYLPKCHTAIRIPGDMNTQQMSAHHKCKNWHRNRHQCYTLKLQTQKAYLLQKHSCYIQKQEAMWQRHRWTYEDNSFFCSASWTLCDLQ